MVSFGCAAVAFLVSGFEPAQRVTANPLVCTYIACGFFEIIGIVTTVQALINTYHWTGEPPQGWAKYRGPAFITAGIALGFIGNVKSITAR
ncbi:hypothetical protein MLAC_31670 [Mycobacterium lacus]|uniref:Uncharacterized protein n=1 Tax=Mycobacterium lacus TaxID=169765 RepID=A0A7I7NNM3_9MYCO|nr:hypothetical protein MLAC_31670 [Mycobacterium lacus]